MGSVEILAAFPFAQKFIENPFVEISNFDALLFQPLTEVGQNGDFCLPGGSRIATFRKNPGKRLKMWA